MPNNIEAFKEQGSTSNLVFEIDDLVGKTSSNTIEIYRGRGRRDGNGVLTTDDRERSSALAAADAVLIFVYDRHGRRQGELGQRREHAEHVERRLRRHEFVVIIKAASERVKFWASEARRVCRAKTPIEWLDGTGIAAVVDGGF